MFFFMIWTVFLAMCGIEVTIISIIEHVKKRDASDIQSDSYTE